MRVQEPQRFALLAPLGVAKAYVFLSLPEDVAETLLSAPQPVPSSGVDKLVSAEIYDDLQDASARLAAAFALEP